MLIILPSAKSIGIASEFKEDKLYIDFFDKSSGRMKSMTARIPYLELKQLTLHLQSMIEAYESTHESNTIT